MAIYTSTSALTLTDWAKRVDPDGRTSMVVNILAQQNDMLDDMLLIEGNMPTGHRTTLATSLPQAQFRTLNQGTTPTKETTAQIDDAAGILEIYSQVDKDLCELNGNTAEFRLSSERLFIEGINQQMSKTVIYGNALTNPATFTGLTPRYNAITAGQTVTKSNIIPMGGTGTSNTSIWLIVWGENTIAGFFPKASQGGLVITDKGLQTVYDNNFGLYEAYRTHYQWKLGLTVRDWRYAVRICNIDTNAIQLSGANTLGTNNQPTLSGKADLITAMQRSLSLIPNMGLGRPVFYMNRGMKSAIDIQAANRPNMLRSVEDVMGKRYDTFQGIPMRITDQLVSTEAAVV